VTVGVQNHHDLASHHDSMFDLIQAVNELNCRAMFDAWTPALHGVDIVEAAKKLAPVTCHTTVADYQLRPRYQYQPNVVNFVEQKAWTQAVPMGEGFIDYRGFLGALAGGVYNGGVAYEMCSPLLGGGKTRADADGRDAKRADLPMGDAGDGARAEDCEPRAGRHARRGAHVRCPDDRRRRPGQRQIGERRFIRAVLDEDDSGLHPTGR
jgi:hypothetical protein